MNKNIFIDTSGYYALLINQDNAHRKAVDILHEAAEEKIQFITSDYILDEIATLLQFRGVGHLLPEFFKRVFNSQACRIEWMDEELFQQTKLFFFKNSDHKYSFTDCFSFILMQRNGLEKALTKDHHFREAGFISLLS
ncbi:MAG: PIN domain-containing protein [bacterium]